MAYNKGEELKNKIDSLSLVLLCVKVLKFIFFGYSFLSFFFWFLNCFEFDWLYLFNWLFIIPYKIVSSFYVPTGVSADFSLSIIGIISLLIGLAFEFISSNIYKNISDLQDSLDEYIKQRKNKKPKKKQQKPIPGEYYEMNNTEELGKDNTFLIFIIQPHIHKIKIKPTDIELTFQDVEIWRQRINKRILENVKYSQPLQKGYYRKNLFLVYKDFNYVDDFVYYIRPTIESIMLEFKKYGIDSQFNYVLSAISDIKILEKELDLMDTILSLNFINIFILTNRFKQAYETKAIKKYTMALKGEYNLSKNLSISNIQPLFIFKNDVE